MIPQKGIADVKLDSRTGDRTICILDIKGIFVHECFPREEYESTAELFMSLRLCAEDL